MAETTYQLIMSAGPTPSKAFPLEKNEIFIGRDLTNDIVINDAEISRRHARLVRQDEGYVVEDLGSTNGTFVNGQRLTGPYFLRSGETITLGEHVTLGYEASAFDPDATIATSTTTAQAAPPVRPQPVQEYSYPKPTPPPSFSGQVPSGPMAVEPPAPRRRSLPVWLIVVLILIVLCLGICVIAGFAIDRANAWCTYMPFIPGCGA
jgi:predicted component of type VI protein secretion system